MAEISSSTQQSSDAEHLKLISIFHYVLSGMAALFGCFPIIHLILGLFIVIAPEKMGQGNQPPPAFIGWFFVVIACAFILAAWAFAVLVLITGRFLALRRHPTFCF